MLGEDQTIVAAKNAIFSAIESVRGALYSAWSAMLGAMGAASDVFGNVIGGIVWFFTTLVGAFDASASPGTMADVEKSASILFWISLFVLILCEFFEKKLEIKDGFLKIIARLETVVSFGGLLVIAGYNVVAAFGFDIHVAVQWLVAIIFSLWTAAVVLTAVLISGVYAVLLFLYISEKRGSLAAAISVVFVILIYLLKMILPALSCVLKCYQLWVGIFEGVEVSSYVARLIVNLIFGFS